MFHSIRTPGPTKRDGMLGLSPSPQMRQQPLTEGRAGGKLGEGRVHEGKRLFEELARKNATPKRALGDKSNHCPSKGGSSSNTGSDGAGTSKAQQQGHPSEPAQSSPTKGKGKERSRSPSKPSLLRTPAPTLSAPTGDQSYATLFSPSPAARQAKDFQTPLAQLGRAGAARARMGELMDARIGEPVIQETLETGPVLTEEEEWPEIEYMPSKASREIPHDLHQLAGLPTGAELGMLLASFSAVGFAGKAHADAAEVEELQVSDLDAVQEGLCLREPPEKAEYDDGWDSVIVALPEENAAMKPKRGVAPIVSLRTKACSTVSAPTAAADSKAAIRKPSTTSVSSITRTRRPLVSSSTSVAVARKAALSTLNSRPTSSARPTSASHKPILARPGSSKAQLSISSSNTSARSSARSMGLKENAASTTTTASSTPASAAAPRLKMSRQMLGLDDELAAFVGAAGAEELCRGEGFAMEEEVVF